MKDLMDYVPKKLRPYAYDAFRDSDGIWFLFKGADGKIPRFYSTDSHSVHEDTINECRQAMKDYVLDDDEEGE